MRAPINGINLAFDDVGRGLPVLWIHGFPINRSLWDPQVAALSDGIRHIVPDLRGFGETDAPEGIYTMDLYADDLRGLLDNLKIERVVVAGLSMGGYIAMAFTRRYPERLLGLLLLDTRAGPDTPEAAQGRRDSAARVLREGVQPVVEPMLAKLFSPTTLAEQPELVESVRKTLLAAPPLGVAGALRGLAERPDSKPGLDAIRVPTLVVVGADDAITPPSEAEAIVAAIAGSRLVTIPMAGHVPNLERPEAFNRAVREFLTELSALPAGRVRHG